MTNSVTFPPKLGGDGSTVTDDDNATTGLGNGGHRTRFVPAMGQIVAIADKLTELYVKQSDTSSTSVAIGTGTKTFTVTGTMDWGLGLWVIVSSRSNLNNWMFGKVFGYNTTSYALEISVSSTNGTGTFNDWSVVASAPGISGITYDVTTLVSQDSETGSANIPFGTTAERTASPDVGSFRFNTDTLKYEGYWSGGWYPAGDSGIKGGGINRVFIENDTAITDDYTISSSKNAGSFGPLTINSGVTVTVPSGSTWTIY